MKAGLSKKEFEKRLREMRAEHEAKNLRILKNLARLKK
jgi:hypothetical protein